MYSTTKHETLLPIKVGKLAIWVAKCQDSRDVSLGKSWMDFKKTIRNMRHEAIGVCRSLELQFFNEKIAERSPLYSLRRSEDYVQAYSTTSGSLRYLIMFEISKYDHISR